MGLLTTTAKKAAKKLADEWDEAAWLKENPRPEGRSDSSAVQVWYANKARAKRNAGREGYTSTGRWVSTEVVDGWDEAAWLKENPRPLPGVKIAEMTPDQKLEYNRWVDAKRDAKHPERRLRQRKAAAKKHKDKKNARARERYHENIDAERARGKKYREENAEREKERAREKYLANPAGYRARKAKRRAAEIDRTPAYSNDEAIKRVYEQAGLLSEASGVPHHVDHVIPLQGENVSGLHVPGNLMIVPDNLNLSKSNSFTPGDDPMRFNDVARQNIEQANEMGLLSFLAKNGDKAGLAGLAGLLASGQSEDADAGFVTRGGKTLLEAFHGSPHKFDRFSMDQIGTGEGAQRYGHGLYFADSEDVARGYQQELAGFEGLFTLDGKPYLYPDNMPVDLDPDAYDLAVQNAGRYGKDGAMEKAELMNGSGFSDEWIKSYKKYVNEVGDRVEYSKAPKGALYRTEIDVTPESLLDWDKPLSADTPQQMKDAINTLVKNNPDLKDDLYQAYREDQPGSIYYSLLSDHAKTGDIVKNQQFATQQLNDAGIKGIKYLDGDSRAAGNGTSNYVIFDDSLINIAERGNADPRLLAGTAAGTAGLLAAPMVKDSGMISAPRSETLFDLTMGARDLERRLEGSPASLLFPTGLVEYLETVNRRTEDPNAMTRGMALLDVLPW